MTDQLHIGFGERRSDELWLGMIVDHRTLFNALQEDQFLPPSGMPGQVLGLRAFNSNGPIAASQRIATRVKFTPVRLPEQEISVRRNGRWVISNIRNLQSDDEAIFWPGSIPTFSIEEVMVSTEEQEHRIRGLAAQVTTITLPPLTCSADTERTLSIVEGPPHAVPPERCNEVELDRIRGATAMAWWAIPRIDPWLDLLAASFSEQQTLIPFSERLSMLAAAVDSPWWTHPPWLKCDYAAAVGIQSHLWIAIVERLKRRPAERRLDSQAFVSECCEAVKSELAEEDRHSVTAWMTLAQGILRSDYEFSWEDSKRMPVGAALLLTLLRPEPAIFATWSSERSLPPAVWWSAAVLCGLLNGYRRLDKQFRGSATQRQHLLAHASGTRLKSAEGSNSHPASSLPELRWTRHNGAFVLSWRGTEVASKNEQERGKWYAADLQDGCIRAEAMKLARERSWPCIHRKLCLETPSAPLAVSGDLVLRNSQLEAKGRVLITIPESASILEDLDDDAFRHSLATQPGELPLPPSKPVPALVVASRTPEHPPIPGLLYYPDFLSTDEERELLAHIDSAPWITELKRRVQHYGWRYDYKARTIDAGMRIGPLPDWAAVLARQLTDEEILPEVPDQVIVNEYVENQGISKHIDGELCFTEPIAVISLLEPWEMVFRHDNERKGLVLHTRSLLVMTGDARYKWTHEIPHRLHEPGNFRRKRRVSVTLRKVISRPFAW